MTYNEFHDENMVFNKETRVNFGQCDIHNQMTLCELLLLTSDTAVEDYHYKGLSWQFLIENSITIIATRLSFKIEKMPKANDCITVRTWEEKPSGIQLTRRYEIIDTNTKEIMITGLSLWTVINFESRKIIPPKNFTLRKEPSLETPFNGTKPGKIQIDFQNQKNAGKHKFTYSDLDANGHANNSKYGNLIVDVLPEKYLEKTFSEVRINYSKEAVLNDEVELFVCENSSENENSVTITGKLLDSVCFECELKYAGL